MLELGCGTGRIAIPAALAGARVLGLDISKSLLAAARRKCDDRPEVQGDVQFICGDMVGFSLRQQFGLVTIPYRTFQHLLTPVDQQHCLHCIRDHLAADGYLIFNTFDPLREMVEQGWSSELKKDTASSTSQGNTFTESFCG